jgi:N-formylglutamate deformylase
MIMNENVLWRKLKVQAFFVTIPHSGEMIPPGADWLQGLSEAVLMRDVDRYVDQLYLPVLTEKQVPNIIATCHRYVIDLNRKPDEYDHDSVEGAVHPGGTHPKGLHWSVTTFAEKLITKPMSKEVHEFFVKTHYQPFHDSVVSMAKSFTTTPIYHLDLHSMPSQGTALHNDPGAKRADVVISDFHGKSARKDFVEMVINSYRSAGFQVAYNWPYFGGGITQMYGRPEQGHHTVQVELNRMLYMDETTKQKNATFLETQKKLTHAIEVILANLPA